jgi:hypothetical protein
VNGQAPPAAGRVLGTGTCIALIAIGAITLPASSPHGLNAHVVDVIVIGAGVLGLLRLPGRAAAMRPPDGPRRRAAGAGTRR